MGLKQKNYILSILLNIMVILMVITTGACGQSESENSLQGTSWKLERYGEEPNLTTVISGTAITIKFDVQEMQVSGSAGCNTYFGDYQADNQRISLSQIGYTEMACMNPDGVMEQEQKYLSALQKAEKYRITGEELRIDCADVMLLYSLIQ